MSKITIYPRVTDKGANHSSIGFAQEVNGNLIHIISETAWSPGIFRNNKRNKENFLYADFIALDVDNNLSLEEAKNRLKASGFRAHLFTSRNHNKNKGGVICDRFRIVFPLEERIDNCGDFAATWKFLHALFPESDPQAKDCSRFFYPSPFNITLTGSKLKPKRAEKKDVRASRSIKHSGNRVLITEGALDFLINAPSGLDGEWNGKLNKAVYELARGGCSRDFALHLIESVAPQALDSSDLTTFNSGFSSGEKKGVYKEANGKQEKPKDEDIYELLEEEFNDQFFIYEDEKGNRGLLLQQIQKDMVVPVSTQKIVSQAASILKDQFNLFLPAKVVERHVENWVTYSNTLKEQPLSFAFKDEPGLAYNKLDFSPKQMETPTFDEFIGRCSNDKALMAFIWSIFENKADRQQYVWIVGEGGNGKSSFLRFLEKCLGTAYTAKSAGDAYQNRYFNAGFIGKRLGVFADANSRGFVSGERFKQLTGGDLVPIEDKYEKPYNARLDTKFILLSNNLPTLSGKAADLRRIILVNIGKFENKPMNENEYLDLWWSEREGILYKCKEAYEELTHNHSIIECDHLDAEFLGKDSEFKFESIMSRFFVLDENASIPAMEVWDTIRTSGMSHLVTMAEFKEYLQRAHKINTKRKGSSYVYQGIRKK